MRLVRDAQPLRVPRQGSEGDEGARGTDRPGERRGDRGLVHLRQLQCRRPYALSFYGDWKYSERPQWLIEAFDAAWNHHRHHNPHHWQHWVLREDSGVVKTLKMPRGLVREMVADWMGAGRAIAGKWEADEWYLANAQTMLLHYETQMLVEMLLGVKAKCGCGALGSTLAKCKQWGHCAAHGFAVTEERKAVIA